MPLQGGWMQGGIDDKEGGAKGALRDKLIHHVD